MCQSESWRTRILVLRIQTDAVITVQYQLFLSDFNGSWISSTNFREIDIYKLFMRIRSVWAELFPAVERTDGQTDVKKLVAAFRNFAKTPNKMATFSSCPAVFFLCKCLKWSEVKRSEVMMLGEMCILSFIYIFVAVCRFCVVLCLNIISLDLLFYNYSTFII